MAMVTGGDKRLDAVQFGFVSELLCVHNRATKEKVKTGVLRYL